LSKKKIIVLIILFIFCGLTIFSFANTNDDGDSKTKAEENNPTTEIESDKKEEEKDTNNKVNGSLNNQITNNTITNDNANNKLDENLYIKALDALIEAEEVLDDDTYIAALNLINNISNNKNEDLLERLEQVKKIIDVKFLVQTLETKTTSATNKKELDSARDYKKQEDIENLVSKLTNKEVKHELQEIMASLNKLLEDKEITINIVDGAILNKKTKVEVKDDNDFKIILTNDDGSEEIENGTELSDGNYELTIVDAAFNEKNISFIVDTIAPKISNISEFGAYFKDDVIPAIEEVNLASALLDGNRYEIGTPISEEGEHTLTVVDKAGNNTTVTFNLDRNVVFVNAADELKNIFADSTILNGKTIVLESDLDMTGIDWQAANNVSFKFDGKGHIIKNITYTTNGNTGLFVNHLGAGEVIFKNLIIDNASITSTKPGDAAVGIFVGDGDTAKEITIINCTVQNSKINNTDGWTGGFVGFTAGWDKEGPVYSTVTIHSSNLINNELTGTGSVGGAVGHAGANPDTSTIVTDFVAKNNIITGERVDKTGIVYGTAAVGDATITNVTIEANKVFGVENSNTLYGRIVFGTTGSLIIDGVNITQ